MVLLSKMETAASVEATVWQRLGGKEEDTTVVESSF